MTDGLSNSNMRDDFQKSAFTLLFLPYNLIDVSYDPDFFYWRKEQGSIDLPDTFNVVVGRLAKFLQAFEEKFHFKK